MKYLVTEIQHLENGLVASTTAAYDTQNEANAAYHQILSAAAVSDLPCHSAIMYTEEGFSIKGECFKHDAEG